MRFAHLFVHVLCAFVGKQNLWRTHFFQTCKNNPEDRLPSQSEDLSVNYHIPPKIQAVLYHPQRTPSAEAGRSFDDGPSHDDRNDTAIFRGIMVLSLRVLFVALVATSSSVAAETAAGKLQLPQLPYPDSALEPHISGTTLQFHHGKHHAKYVATTNSMIEGTKYETLSLVEIIRKAHSDKNQALFNNAAQSYNHAFYFQCMKANGGGTPSGILLEKLVSTFGSLEEFKKQFSEAGNTAFGSGWAWLVYNTRKNKLLVEKTTGADTPLTNKNMVPLLCMDVWEHAYYLDYQNRRPSYVDAFLDHLVNWDFVEANLESAMSSGRGVEL
jgi:Fe-Mn family superoxide dismutase